ncbi:MAG: GNAT family N-acetyltransferase [archaeon]|nr:GNAT family N-acetyltransferase [archaeon]
MEVKIIENSELIKSFLKNNNHYLFHTPEFAEFISKAFFCRYVFCAALDNGEIKTILPIVEVKSKIFGNKIINSGYIEYGGFAGDPVGVTPIINHLEKIYGQVNEYLEIRGSINNSNIFDDALSKNEKIEKRILYKRFVLPLGSKEGIWKNIQKSKRKAINRGLEQLNVRELTIDDLPAFYRLYSQNMRRFGSPPYSLNYFALFFKNIVEKGFGKIYCAYREGVLISALLGFTYQDRVHILISVSDPKYNEYRPSDAVHWKFIEYACNNGYKYFDFGRVREESGQFEYKRKWGPELLDLPSYFMLWKAKKIPIVDPQNTKYKIVTKVWKCLPLKVTIKIGPKLRKELGI